MEVRTVLGLVCCGVPGMEYGGGAERDNTALYSPFDPELASQAGDAARMRLTKPTPGLCPGSHHSLGTTEVAVQAQEPGRVWWL